jgi:excisionase family DNA binding protein
MFVHILALLGSGQGVQIIPDAAELTTQQAADFLNVSRPYLIGLLEADEIPYRMVGTHRRIRFEDLRDYRRQDDLKRRQAADELTRLMTASSPGMNPHRGTQAPGSRRPARASCGD